jgi:hypothetical protein
MGGYLDKFTLQVAVLRELSLAQTVEQCRKIKTAYLGKNGIIRQMEKALWKSSISG